MANPFHSCNDDALRELLSGGDRAEPTVAEHLESCSRCQSRLTELAGSNDDWQQTRQFLAADCTDDADAEYSAEARERPWTSATTSTTRPTAWTETMAKQLLSPPSHPE